MGLYVATEIEAERARAREPATLTWLAYLATRADDLDYVERLLARSPGVLVSAGFWSRLHEALEADR